METKQQPADGAASTMPLDAGVDHDDFDADQVLPDASRQWRKPAPEDGEEEPPRRRVSKSLSVEPLTVCGIEMGCDHGPSIPSLFDSAPVELPGNEAKTYDEWIARPSPGSLAAGRFGDPANGPVEWTGMGASVPNTWSELPLDPGLAGAQKRADDDVWRRLADVDDARSSEDELFQRWLRKRRHHAERQVDMWQQRADDDDDDDDDAQATAAPAEAPCPENPNYPIDPNDPNGWREWLRCFKKDQAGGQGLQERICFKRRTEALAPQAPAPAFAVTSQPQMVLEASAPEPTARQPDIGGEDIDIGPDDWPPPPDHETCDI